MRHRYLLPLLLILLSVPISAQPAAPAPTAPARPDHAERIRPSLDRKRDRSKGPAPYLMQAGRPVASPIFRNVPATVEANRGEDPQNESSIAVNPLRPNVLLASAVDYRNGAWAYVSTDAGSTWRNISLGNVRNGWPSGNDPSVAFDHLGNGYVMYGALVRGNVVDPSQNGQSGIYVSKTTDDGVTWTKHLTVIEHVGATADSTPLEDKYYIEIDRSATSPYLGWMYAPWKRVIDRDSSTQIMFARSTNGGVNWDSAVAISVRKPGTSLDTTWGQSFPLAAAGPDGTVYVAWHDGTVRSIGFARSTNGGTSFTAPRHIVEGNETHGTPKRSGNEVYHVLKNTFRAQTYPTMAADNSDSTRRGWLYLAWAAGRQPNIYFIRSTDRGETWTAPKVIHSDTTNDQWWPWLAVDPSSGDIAVMYSDSRNDPENIFIDQYVSYSSDGGDTWIDRRATDAMSDFRKNPFGGIFAGDYSGNAFFDGRIYPSFLDTREAATNDNDVYVSLMSIWRPYPVDSLRALIDPTKLTELELRWQLPQRMETIFGKPIDSYSIIVERDSAALAVLPAGTTSLAQGGLEHSRLYTYSVRIATATDTSIARWLPVRAGGAKEPAAPELISATSIEDSVFLTFCTPSFRADMQVPLANFDAVRIYRDGESRAEVPFFTTDTGRTITIKDVVRERGYYRYFVTALDTLEPPNESAPSDTLIAYAGSYATYRESFDAGSPRFLYSGDWGLSDSLALSQPSSLTDSPGGDYRARQTSSTELYPVHGAVLLGFAHIAIVDPSDTAFVEYRRIGDTSWTTLRAFTWSAQEMWSDSVASPGDWVWESMAIPQDSIVVRFRLKTNTFRNADGWYIDDVEFSTTLAVEREEVDRGLAVSTRPNPFRSATIIEYTLEARSDVRLRLVDLLGRELRSIDLGTQEAGRHAYTLDGTGLSAGTYVFELATPERRTADYLLKQP